jgi:CheY-like chemotaxis protein
VVVDDNQLTLPGFAQAVADADELELVGAFGHEDALRWAGDWAAVDVVVVDAADEGRPGDQFPGVAVVRWVRTAASARQPLVVVVTGHYLHEGLRHRMAEAQADFYFLRSDLRSPEALVDVVLHPERHRRGVPEVADARAGRRLGVAAGSDVESFVGWVEARNLGPDLSGARGDRDQPRSRRWVRLRREAADAGAIEPSNLTTGDAPRGQSVPSIRQLSRLWEWAARIRPRDH